MKPYVPRKRKNYRKRFFTYKRLFLITLIALTGYMWYQTCDEICVNDKQTKIEEVR